VAERQIVGVGGGGDTPDQNRALLRHILSLTGKERPRVLHVPTAVGDAAESIVQHYERVGGLCELSHLRFFPWPPDNLRELVLAQDAVSVGGGNPANMFAIWRVHGFDGILREAWESGVLLYGVSAGMVCWFEACITDSFGPQLEGMRDGLGFLAGSACPHYDGEPLRRPRYRALVDGGFPEGIAAEDGVGLHFVGSELREVVTCRPGATAYRVTRERDEPLEARELV
jgi:dipeptidase E